MFATENDPVLGGEIDKARVKGGNHGGKYLKRKCGKGPRPSEAFTLRKGAGMHLSR